MERARKVRIIWLIVGIVASVLAALAIPAIVLSALNGEYLLMGVAIALVAHGMYGVTFYFLAFARAGDRLRCLSAVGDGLRSYSSVGAVAQLAPSAARETLATCLKRGYLRGFYLGTDGLLPIVSEEDDSPKERACEYCGRVFSSDECPSCGAGAASAD